ncbi:BTB/POZ domain-containing protein 3-like [Paramacrobiotus metropolitanus]|uniref:BTB/POZ domain-containing protein 3-like n=1 Tax=Paramacrobiotus metropolitanus TaxID=2943436 RepID=UPI002445A91E|nr:BTB/POZ domain-containing protein 3-like [Paramacrobiotus metropolitanus]
MSRSSMGSPDRGNRGEATKLAECMKQVLACGDMSDVQFAVGRDYGAVRIFPAHRVIMGARSDVFHKMFFGSIPENCAAPVDIPDILPDAFSNMLSYIYTDTVKTLSKDNVFQTLVCADKYDIPSLMEKCTRFIMDNLDTDNCLEHLEKIIRHKCTAPRVTKKCLRLIDESAEGIWLSDHFLALGQETLQSILQRDTLAADEDTIYWAVEKWASSACKQRNMEASAVNRREILGPALHLIRFPLLTEAQLMDGPAETGLLLHSELLDIVRFKHAAVKPELPFCTVPRQNDLRTEGIINFTVPDIRKLDETHTLSDPITVRKLPWRILVKKHIKEGSPYLGYFVWCGGSPKSASWKCQADAELRLLPWKEGVATVKNSLSHAFCQKVIDFGYPDFISFQYLLDSEKGYVSPGQFALKLQVKITAHGPAGVE